MTEASEETAIDSCCGDALGRTLRGDAESSLIECRHGLERMTLFFEIVQVAIAGPKISMGRFRWTFGV